MARLALIDQLLAEQRTLSAVESFARAHDAGELPAMERHYRRLLPATAPGPGQQYAFEVDIDACTGCKGCVTACHRLNGLEPGETWRRVGIVQGGDAERAVRQTITTACHHCAEPACAAGCPVEAYRKDPITGIVHHLDDQCIGCKYCLFTCPYDVPQYSASKGIVRKCDMCSGRLAAGEAPACVQACPNQAISIRLVDRTEIEAEAARGPLVPGAPDASLTLPSTRYRSKRPLPADTVPADFHVVRAEAAHPPLAIMLVLTQVAVGVFGLTQLIGGAWRAQVGSSAIALAVAVIALGASTLHLGRPQYAFRAVLGLRRSWLSREILLFGAFVALTVAHVVARSWIDAELGRALGVMAAGVGVVAVYSSVMVYAVTGRPCWRLPATAWSFFATALIGGSACLLALAATWAVIAGEPVPAAVITAGRVGALALAAHLAWELWLLRRGREPDDTAAGRRAALLLGELATFTQLRFLFGVSGLAFFAAAARSPDPALAIAAALLVVGGELVGRHLFFVAAPARRMPGESP